MRSPTLHGICEPVLATRNAPHDGSRLDHQHTLGRANARSVRCDQVEASPET